MSGTPTPSIVALPYTPIPFNDGNAVAAVAECERLAAAISLVNDAFAQQVSQCTDGWSGYYRGIFNTEVSAVGTAGSGLVRSLTLLAADIKAAQANVDAENAAIAKANKTAFDNAFAPVLSI